ncbi:Hypothetical protein NocV09_01300580 [Nannochloropsis oceanica]
MGGTSAIMKRDKEWQEVLGAVHEISNLLNTGLDRQTLAILVNLCEAGVNPEALALVVQELRKEAASKQQQQQQQQHQQEQATGRDRSTDRN